VTRVVQDGIKVARSAACLSQRGVGDVDGVAEGTIVDGVVEALDLLSTEKIVNGAILHDEDDNILDLVLEVRDGGI